MLESENNIVVLNCVVVASIKLDRLEIYSSTAKNKDMSNKTRKHGCRNVAHGAAHGHFTIFVFHTFPIGTKCPKLVYHSSDGSFAIIPSKTTVHCDHSNSWCCIVVGSPSNLTGTNC